MLEQVKKVDKTDPRLKMVYSSKQRDIDQYAGWLREIHNNCTELRTEAKKYYDNYEVPVVLVSEGTDILCYDGTNYYISNKGEYHLANPDQEGELEILLTNFSKLNPQKLHPGITQALEHIKKY